MALSKKTILIVDDQEINRTLLSVILNDSGEKYHILTAGNGVEALRVLSHERARVDLILLDIVMPEMDGFAFLEEMKLRSLDIPVILISAETSQENILKGMKMGVRDVIAKPFDPYLIHNRVDNLIELTGIQNEQTAAPPLNKTVLIVDDSLFNRKTLQFPLGEDYEILEAQNGNEAISMVEKMGDRISVILLDISMPIMDGVAVMRHWRATGIAEKIPVIALTSEYDYEKVREMIEFGVYDIITAPFFPEVIKRRVDNIVALSANK